MVIQVDTMIGLEDEREELATPGPAQSERMRGLEVLSGRKRTTGAWLGLLGKPWNLARRSLAARLTVAAIGVTFLLLLLGSAIGIAMMKLSDQIEQGQVLREASIASSELTTSIAETRYYATRYAATGDGAEIGKARATLSAAKTRLSKTIDGFPADGQQAREALQWVVNDVDGLDQELTVLEQSVRTQEASDTSRSIAKGFDISGGQLALEVRAVEDNLGKASTASDEALTQLMRRAAVVVMTLLVICIAITLLGARFIATTTAGSVRQITRAMSNLAGGDREIAIPGTARRDEIGEMARALEVFRASALELAELQKETAEAAQQEIARREEIKQARIRLTAELADKFEATVGQVVGSVAAASSQLQDTANSMASTASQASQYANEVANSMDGTSTGVTAAASASDQFAMSIGEISRQAASSAELARDARVSAEEADTTIASLALSTEQIGKIVELIHSIAERTNLLALNASIEAARGAEAGRGFAVVAAEVKELARRTSSATDEIATQIREIQHSSRDSVAALKRIGQQIRQVEGNASAIAQSVDEQSVASTDLARNLDLAAGGTEKIRTNVGQVREMSLSTGSAASQVLGAANGLQQQAAALRGQVEDFLGYIRAA